MALMSLKMGDQKLSTRKAIVYVAYAEQKVILGAHALKILRTWPKDKSTNGSIDYFALS